MWRWNDYKRHNTTPFQQQQRKNEYNGNNTNILSKSSHRFISCVFFLLPQNRILGLTTVQRISFIKTGR